MNKISGRGGNVFAVGDKFRFKRLPLHDLGDGWTWAAPDGLGCWTDEVSCELSEDGENWEQIDPEEVYPHMGRVVFPYAVRGWVRATGSCYPTSYIGWGNRWQILMETEVNATPTIGATSGADVKTLSTVAEVDGVISQPLERAMVLLPFQQGWYVGLGRLTQMSAGIRVTFNDEGVTYEPCN